MREAPYLSVVVTARNDDHGGNLLGRMQAFVNGLLMQCERYRVPTELVLVEWNPLVDRAGLAEALDWSKRNAFADVRIITVPHEIHRRLKHWEALPLYQMIAKNVGIRRARGEFVLATNIDLLFSNELFEYLAGRRLEHGKMYRVDRWDVMSDVPVGKPLDEQLAWCNAHLLRVNRREGTFALNPDGAEKIDPMDIAAPERGVSLGKNWFHLERSGEEAFRWVENDAELVIDAEKTGRGAKFLVLDIEPGPGVDSSAFLLHLREPGGRTVASVGVERRTKVTLPVSDLTASGPRRLRLYTSDGGRRVADENRVLNFRVFRCDLSATGVSNAVARTGDVLTRLGRAARVLSAGLFNTSEIRIPMSPERLRRLNVHVDGIAVVFELGPLFGKRSLPQSVAASDHAAAAAPAPDPAAAAAPVPPPDPPAENLHTNACGDFTLMAREHWFDLRGYPELDAFSMNIDSVLCWMAHHGGAREEVLPFRIFHIEHATGSGWTPEGERKLYERILAKGLPWIEYRHVIGWARTMSRFDSPLIFNRGNWGFESDDLSEIHLSDRNV